MRISLLVVFLLVGAALPIPAHALQKKPKLILALVIDQFRADYLFRFEKRFLPAHAKNGDVGGMKFLMATGAYFPYGKYGLIQNMTGPGHATVLSGSYPYTNGITINYWYDHATGQQTYCTEDASQAAVGSPGWPHMGSSPKNFHATTVGDEIKNAGYPAHVVSIALKDRAAILMGGHRADLALWLDSKELKWISSRFYLPDGKLPSWLDALNAKMSARKGEALEWKLAGPGTGYTEGDERFPHVDKLGSRKSFAAPISGELTVDVAEAALDAYKLGTHAAPDVLAVSFSAHDYVGHAYGPNSREIEEMTVAEDRQIARLLNHVRKRLGSLKDVMLVLTADHGTPLNPDYARAHGIDAGRIDEDGWATKLAAHLDDRFGKPKGGWIPYAHDFNFYLSDEAIADRKVSRAEVEAEAKRFLGAIDGVAYIVTSTEYAERKLPPGIFAEEILRQYVPGKTGDLLLIPRPFWMKTEDPVDHLTGYEYDRTVPIVFAGFGIRRGVFSNPAAVVDIAPTLTFLAGAMPPALNEGRVLTEALLPEEIH